NKPRARSACARDATGFGHLGDAVSDFLVGFFRLSEQPAKCLVVLGADAAVVPVAAKFAARLRAPGNDADAFGRTQRQHLALLFAVEQVDEVLHADEACPAMLLGNAERPGELPRMHRRGTDVARLASLDDVVRRLERLLDWRIIIPAVDLVEVDIIHTQPSEAGVDLGEDCLARQPGAVRAGPHASIDSTRENRRQEEFNNRFAQVKRPGDRRSVGWLCRRGGRRLRACWRAGAGDWGGGGSGYWRAGRTAVCGRRERAAQREPLWGGDDRRSG